MVHTVVFRVIDGDVYEQPVDGYATYRAAMRRALAFHGLSRSEVVLCLSEGQDEATPRIQPRN